ncbi:MAG TPA: RodZ domain-containing protein [Burkholderiaceae bacterium]|nr:RodZ domain-containing protein [Burkholderiaceae bacterium]
MNETAIAQETMPEISHQASRQDFGALLRNARLAAGMDVETLAGRLRLHPKQIEALERADLSALPSAIYVRGFLRGCARELKIDPQPLLADLDRKAGVDTSTLPAPSAGPTWRFRVGDGTKPIVAVLLFVLVLAGLVGTLIPRRTAAPLRPSSPPVQAPAPAQPATTPSAAASAPPPEVNAEVTPNPPAPLGAEPASETLDLRAAAHPVTAPNAVPSPAGQTTGGSTSGSATKTTVSEHANNEARGANVSELVLRIHDEAWVEVVQGDGTTLLSQICAPGTIQTIKGKEPLHVVIGNPSGVDALFRGVPVDLARHASPNGVARLTLE